MRRLPLALALVAVLLGALVAPSLSGAEPGTTGRTDPVPYDEIPNVVLDLPDGDKIALGAPDYTRVMIQRYDASTARWSRPTVFFRKKGLECGGLDARTASGAVAVYLKCQPSWSDDQAPADSIALYSSDTFSWTRHRLDYEATEEPGIAPGGQAAVWPTGQGRYVTWTAAGGFTEHELRAPDEEYTLTAVISDTAAVSYVYGAPMRSTRGCGLVVLTRTGDARPVRQEVRIDEVGCSDTGLSNIDADTLVAGEPDSVAGEWTIARSAPTEPFAVTAIAPYTAPGLTTYPYQPRRAMDERFFSAVGLPLFAIGSPDRRRVMVQRYDPVAQRWAPAVEVYDRGFPGCAWVDEFPSDSLGIVAAEITCYARPRSGGYPPSKRGWPLPRNGHRLLTTTDGETWQLLRLGRRPLGVSADGAYLAVPSRRAVTVLSQERGLVRLPLPVSGRCALVVPGGPDTAALLTAGRRSRGWPSALYVSTPGGWSRDGRVAFPEPPRVRCRRVDAFLWDTPIGYYFSGRRDGYLLRVAQRGGRWRVDATLDY